MSKQLLTSTILSAISLAVLDPSFKPKVSDLEPYAADNGLFSIVGFVGIAAPINPVAGYDASHIEMRFECRFHNCKADRNTATYSGDPNDYELFFGELDDNLFFANQVKPSGRRDWQYQEGLNLTYHETCEISKAVFTQFFADISIEQKKALLLQVYKVLSIRSPMAAG